MNVVLVAGLDVGFKVYNNLNKNDFGMIITDVLVLENDFEQYRKIIPEFKLHVIKHINKQEKLLNQE